METRHGTPKASERDTPEEGFHMHSYSAGLPTYKPAPPGKDAKTRSYTRSPSRSDPTRLVDNIYERTCNCAGPTRCGHRPYMAATHNVVQVHQLELTETAENHTNTPDGPDTGDHVDQASIANTDTTTEEVWRPSSRQSSMDNAEEKPIDWAEWIDLSPSLGDSPTPLTALPLVAPYRRAGPLHLNNEPVQEHSASMSRQHSTARSGPGPLGLKEALSLIRSTEAQKLAPESTFTLCASSKDPFMGHSFPYLDNGFIEFAKSALSSTLELPDQCGAPSSRCETASSLDVAVQSAQQQADNMSALWQEIQDIAYGLKITKEWTYVLCSRILILLVRGRLNEAQARTRFHYILHSDTHRHLQLPIRDLFNRNAVALLKAYATFVIEQLRPEHPAAFTCNIPRSVEKSRFLDRNFVDVVDTLLLMDFGLKKLVQETLEWHFVFNEYYKPRRNIEDVPAHLRVCPVVRHEVRVFLDRLVDIPMSFVGVRQFIALMVGMDLPAFGTFGALTSRTTNASQ